MILVAEDTAANMKLCTELLIAQGYTVPPATNGADGLRLASERRPDLILMDMQLPDTCGLDVTCRIKADTALKSIPVIAVTALVMKGNEEKYLQGGCDAYISKPKSIVPFSRDDRRLNRESRWSASEPPAPVLVRISGSGADRFISS